MKKLIYIVVLCCFACDSEDAWDCFQTAGEIIETEIEIESFDRILVNRDIELVIKEAPEFKVTIQTGKNLINDVSVKVIDNQLILTDNNTCNYNREYGLTKVFVEAPNLSEIRTSSQYEISSDGILNYNNLTLFSEDFYGESEFTVGDFKLSINSQSLFISSNNISFFYIDGQVNNLFVGFYSGSGRFEGRNLEAQNIQVFHRGSNDMIVNPIQSLSGELRGIGNLIAVNEPPIVDVERFYTGRLIFN
ncbi:head GIN domain-containing protein [Winogradskyella sp.]|uniref:head GIN domain-containing protein n=1 Tax=Winogradskyella sp. TaxID=1883156 RepID=UPI003F6A8627